MLNFYTVQPTTHENSLQFHYTVLPTTLENSLQFPENKHKPTPVLLFSTAQPFKLSLVSYHYPSLYINLTFLNPISPPLKFKKFLSEILRTKKRCITKSWNYYFHLPKNHNYRGFSSSQLLSPIYVHVSVCLKFYHPCSVSEKWRDKSE